jgi:anti-sigma regulatory factor (Ser/Thr protein kinase)
MPTLRLSLSDDPADLEAMVGAVERFVAANGIDAGVLARLLTALDEVVTNVAKYGQPQKGAPIVIELARRDDGIHAVIEDQGKPFDPLTRAPGPDLEASLDQREVGGLGLHIVRMLTADLAYARTAAGRNRLSFRIAC